MDTLLVPEVPLTEPVDPDVRDPRTRRYGHVDPANMDPTHQTQNGLAVSAVCARPCWSTAASP